MEGKRGRTWAEGGEGITQWHPGACLGLTVPSRFDQWVIPPASQQRSSLLMSACLDMFHFLTVSSGRERGMAGENPSRPHRSVAPRGTPPREGEVPSSGGVSNPRRKTDPPRPHSLHSLPDSSSVLNW